MMISGHRKSFHDHMNWMIASVASAGNESGKTILNRIPSREVPSIRAASSSSIGSVRKNWRNMKIPNALHRLGMIRPPTLSTSPRCLTIRNVGISRTWNGTISVASSTTNSTSRPKNLNRANA